MRWMVGFAWILVTAGALGCGSSNGDGGLDAGLDGSPPPSDATEDTAPGDDGGTDAAPATDANDVCDPLEACTAGDTVYCGFIDNPCGTGFFECPACEGNQVCAAPEPGALSVCGLADDDCEEGLCLHQVNCEDEVEAAHEATTLTGTVYAPNGETPINNALVYVPNDPDPSNLAAITEGASCERCEDEDLGNPIAAAITGPDGSFTIRHVPAGVAFPLVIRSGKWRRVVMMDPVEACDEQALDGEDTRLPSNSTEGHIPRIAVVTGAADALECVLYRLGVQGDEFTRPSFDAEGQPLGGRIHLYRSSGAWADEELATECPLNCWNDLGGCDGVDEMCTDQLARNLYQDGEKLHRYDMTFFGCDFPINYGQPEGANQRESQWSAEDFDRIRGYADDGGRLFLSHFNYQWLEFDPGEPSMSSLAQFRPDPNDAEQLGDDSLSWIVTEHADGEPFLRGLTFLQWLEGQNALFDPAEFDADVPGRHCDVTQEGDLCIDEPRTHILDVNEGAQRWVHTTEDDHGMDSVQAFTFDMPMGVPEEETCGRGVYSAFHVTGGDEQTVAGSYFPQHCPTGPLSPQELALVFMMFDLGACIAETREPPGGCVPIECEDVGAACGSVVDGCGGLLNCGGCPENHICNPANNTCTFAG
jgi:hypothetical protein